jgi:GNAT superfamily N-acetyltransferase
MLERAMAELVPDGFSLRGVSLADAPSICDIIDRCMLDEIGLPWTDVEETRSDLEAPGRDGLELDALVVDERTGGDVGYLQLWNDIPPFTEVFALAYALPEYRGRGLSACLLRLAETRARDRMRSHGLPEIALQAARFDGNEPARRLFMSLGFRYVRTFFRMQIVLDELPSQADITGIAMRTFDLDRDAEGTHAALAEAFRDHWGHGLPGYAQWRHAMIEGEGSRFDAGLWFLACDGPEIVGAACCRASTPRDPTAAEVDELGVRRDWRGRGIGLALLQRAFVEFDRRGIRRAELTVDAASPTGALGLYRRAGMDVRYASEIWQKDLE